MSSDIQTSGDWHWRNSMKPVRFFALDARVSLFFMVFLVHMRPSTLTLFIMMSLLFWILERKGLTFDAAIRSFRTWILGTERPGLIWHRKRRLIDYG